MTVVLVETAARSVQDAEMSDGFIFTVIILAILAWALCR